MYLSPEAIENPEGVDGRSDIYSVGAVGYFLLTGQTLFEGHTVTQIIMHQVSTIPQTPSHRAGSSIPKGLESV